MRSPAAAEAKKMLASLFFMREAHRRRHTVADMKHRKQTAGPYSPERG
ncbi:hypothetical protein ACZ87_03475 [Candidatus Erwinia dacicola]|uniref:Uncharacterized protein n=1 Tax=Candidatus Erwinia dacicola TaxID=252393 RepID=A0A328TK89_9GAMM|nr:hypothetical protein ACZ87_03475 [Candidatus Erwinia dacicola]